MYNNARAETSPLRSASMGFLLKKNKNIFFFYYFFIPVFSVSLARSGVVLCTRALLGTSYSFATSGGGIHFVTFSYRARQLRVG